VVGPEDLALHRELTAKERLDAILEAPHLTESGALAAMNAQFAENQATFPHVVIATVMVEESFGSQTLVPWVSYIGPHRDRRAAEAWATATFADNEHVSWTVEKMETPEMHEAGVRKIRAIVDRGDPDKPDAPPPT
jgi:hypothetical protein